MNIYASLLVTTIQMYQVWYILFLFPIDTADEKWSSLFVMPVKENDNYESGWLAILARTFPRYLFSSY